MTCCICRVALIVSENQLVEYVYEAVEDVIALHLNPFTDGKDRYRIVWVDCN